MEARIPNEFVVDAILLTRKDVVRLTRLSRASIERYHRDGRFPKPVKLGPNRVAWLKSEVDSWIADRVAERDEAVRHG